MGAWRPLATASAYIIPPQRCHSASPHIQLTSQAFQRMISVVMWGAVSALRPEGTSDNAKSTTEMLPDVSPNFLPNH